MHDKLHAPTYNSGSIIIPKTTLDIASKRVLVLGGMSGCGKTSLLNWMAGLYDSHDENLIEIQDLKIQLGSTQTESDFRNIQSKRFLIAQFVTEMYLCDGFIEAPLKDLFPHSKSIDEIKEFLTTGFLLKETVIPKSLNDCPPKTLSGGEKQRFVIAIQVWLAQLSRPDIVMLDEIDRSLDPETAVHMMDFVLKKLNC